MATEYSAIAATAGFSESFDHFEFRLIYLEIWLLKRNWFWTAFAGKKEKTVENWARLNTQARKLNLKSVKRFWKISVLSKFWELFGFLAHLEPEKITFFFGKKAHFSLHKSPPKRAKLWPVPHETKNWARELPSQIYNLLRSLPDWSGKKSTFFFSDQYGPLY